MPRWRRGGPSGRNSFRPPRRTDTRKARAGHEVRRALFLPMSTAETNREASRGQAAAITKVPRRPWYRALTPEAGAVALALGALVTGAVLDFGGYPALGANLAYLIAYLAGGWFGVTSAVASLREKTIDIDLLMVLAALGAAIIGEPFEGALLLFLFALSNVMQDWALMRTREAIGKLAELKPQTAEVIEDGRPVERRLEEIAKGSRLLIRPGQVVPLDGKVLKGESSVDESTLTGEAVPAAKEAGDEVFAGTFNQAGSIEVETTTTAQDSTLAKMIHMVEQAQHRKAKTQRFFETYEQRWALVVIALTGALMLVLPLVFGVSWEDGFYRAITVMVVASPCALVISTPVCLLSGMANGARSGVLFKGGVQLEEAAQVTAVAFDKTGTLTNGRFQVHDVAVASDDLDRATALRWIGALEAPSEHPLAKALVAAAREETSDLPTVDGFQAQHGHGVEGVVDGQRLIAGNWRWIAGHGLDDQAEAAGADQRDAFAARGMTVIALAAQENADATPRPLAFFALADEVRPEAKHAIKRLREMGIERILMLTGDGEAAAQRVAQATGIDEIHAQLRPEEKLSILEEMRGTTPVAMVGDGVNDTPALAASSLGIAMGAAGSDVALDAADIVLMANDLHRVPEVLALGRQTHRILWQNLTAASGIIVAMVLATLLLPIWGLFVPLPVGVVAHEGGTVLVALNGLRLLRYGR